MVSCTLVSAYILGHNFYIYMFFFVCRMILLELSTCCIQIFVSPKCLTQSLQYVPVILATLNTAFTAVSLQLTFPLKYILRGCADKQYHFHAWYLFLYRCYLCLKGLLQSTH